MTQKEKSDPGVSACAPSCCRVESLVTVDERGQMVLPKEIRDKANIKPGDKLAVISWEKNGEISCISLIRAEEFGGMVRELLGPMMGEVLGNETVKNE